MIAWKLVMVEVEFIGVVPMADIDYENSGVLKIGLTGLLSVNHKFMFGNQEATSEKLVFMRTARMRDDVFRFQIVCG